jgi:hypothetical protein
MATKELTSTDLLFAAENIELQLSGWYRFRLNNQHFSKNALVLGKNIHA